MNRIKEIADGWHEVDWQYKEDVFEYMHSNFGPLLNIAAKLDNWLSLIDANYEVELNSEKSILIEEARESTRKVLQEYAEYNK